MQARAVRSVAQRKGWKLASPVTAHHRRSSFIKEVMEQVKRDMEKNEKLKKDWDTVQKSSQKFREHGSKQEERLEKLGEQLKSASSKTSEFLSEFKNRAQGSAAKASEGFSKVAEENEAIRKAKEALGKGYEAGAAGSQTVFSKTRDIFAGAMDTTSGLFDRFGDEDKRAEKLKQWKAARDAAAAAQEAEEAKKEANKDGDAQETAQAEPVHETAMVVAKDNTSSWDRFGAGLRDMPFLSNVFENPFFDKVFGESEIAASIREMKEMDYNFYMEDFAEEIEYVVAPHIIKTYLEGDQTALEQHCGEAAFAAVNASIKARLQQKLTLDTAILAGPQDVELKGAKLMEKGSPCFIWTFNMQQVNCLRNSEGEIIEGAVDDIRTVCYAMAVTKHPDVEAKLELQYPWQISELAILWNQPCW